MIFKSWSVLSSRKISFLFLKGLDFCHKSWTVKLNAQAYIAVLNPNEMISADAVAVTFGGKITPPLFYVIPAFVAMSAFGAINSQIMTTSRLLLVASRSQFSHYLWKTISKS